MNWLWLALAILLEIVGTTCLKAAEGFTRPLPTAIVISCYAGAFWCLSLALRSIPMGIAYAIWSGIGIVAISILGFVVYRQSLDPAVVVGIGFIVAGVLIINLMSKAAAH